MPYRKTIFANKHIYHIINRGADQIPIFKNKRDYNRFLETISYYRYNPELKFSHFNRLQIEERNDFLKNLRKNSAPIVEILAFALMPNHFHLLLKQLQGSGIKMFMQILQNSYAKYFNAKHKRSGTLFQAPFKAVMIETDEQLTHVSRYIHLNPVSSNIISIDNLESFHHTSFTDYLGKNNFDFVNSKSILKYFSSPEEYKEFVYNRADYQQRLEIIKHLAIEK